MTLVTDGAAEAPVEQAAPSIERRALPGAEILAAASAPRLVGHPAVFGELSHDLGGFRERFLPGAFARTLASPTIDVPLLVNHAGLPLASVGTGTLALYEDTRGLAMDATLDDTDPDSARIVAKVRRGLVHGGSIAFEVVADSWSTAGGTNVRTVAEARLFDVSAVTTPAYPATALSTRSLGRIAGIDLAALAAALVRAERALPPLEGDAELLHAADAVLQRRRTPALLRWRMALAERCRAAL